MWILPEEPEVEDESVNSEKNHLAEFVDFFGSIPGFTNCDKEGAMNWVNHDSNDPGYQMLDGDENMLSIKINMMITITTAVTTKARMHRANLRMWRHLPLLKQVSDGSKDKKNVAQHNFSFSNGPETEPLKNALQPFVN